jgi:hypothetical protein
MHTSLFAFQQSLKTPLDCPCGGDGILFLDGGQSYCPSHFHMSKSEEYRAEVLRLCYVNLCHFTLEVESRYKAGLPNSREMFDLWVRTNHKPLELEDWVKGAQSLVEQEVGYVLFSLEKGILG